MLRGFQTSSWYRWVSIVVKSGIMSARNANMPMARAQFNQMCTNMIWLNLTISYSSLISNTSTLTRTHLVYWAHGWNDLSRRQQQELAPKLCNVLKVFPLRSYIALQRILLHLQPRIYTGQNVFCSCASNEFFRLNDGYKLFDRLVPPSWSNTPVGEGSGM